ncbi:MAG: hypothetical protein H7X77_04545, partial [Anaerolineae bacterium]|nr:hypothetical protein [Anaerolineae bacterium]
QQGGMNALIPYWKPFDVHAVERVLSDYPTGHVIAFGAGHSVYEDEAQFVRVQTALANFPQVILILPAPDVDESLDVLRQHLIESEPDLTAEVVDGLTEINRRFLMHPSNTRLATITIYNAGQSAEVTCREIERQLNAK